MPPSTAFTIGTFTHDNNPIQSGTDINGVSLRLTTDLHIDGTDFGLMTFDYAFHHEETPNTAPCAYGAPGNTPCPDRVTVGSLPTSQTFFVDGIAYTLSFSSFVKNGVSTPDFISQENQTNTAQIQAVVTTAVPEPASWAMLVAGFGLVGLAVRRRARLRLVSAI